MRVRVSVLTALVVATFASGCATKASDVTAVYVSPLQYANYDCSQLRAETQRLHVRVQQITGIVDEKANNTNIATAATVVLFWPAAFFVSSGASKEQQAELARLKGEQEALQQAAIQNKCPGVVTPIEPKPTEAKQPS